MKRTHADALRLFNSNVPPKRSKTGTLYIADAGRAAGPFGVAQLAAEAQAGRLSRTTLVWTAGMAAWEPAGQVGALAALFGPPAPPPIPGA